MNDAIEVAVLEAENEELRARVAELEVALAKREADGFVLVPVEPTEAMLDAAVAMALQVSVSGQGGWTKYAAGLYAQMLAAAQQAAKEDV